MDAATPRGPEALGLDPETAMSIAELSEARALWSTVALSPRGVRRAMGIQAATFGSGIALAMQHDPTGGYWSRALAHGLTEPVDDALVGRLVDFFRGAEVPAAAIQIPDVLLPGDWDQIAARHHLRAGRTLVKLIRHRSTPVAEAPTELRVSGIDARDAPAWAEVLIRGFGMPTQEDLVAMLASIVGRDFYAYGAFDGDRLVAAANVFIGGDVAHMAGSSTLPDSRRRGAQAALLRVRIEAATDMGCTWITAEAPAEDDPEGGESLRTMRRAGFVELYRRRNWVWRPSH
ncbi:GNAT family N-acetyltransferase [Demequina sp. SYSU T00068]|uniref:GNAT family N-acetyltransferase n=1 Tax=Demequina lignilytica TaxID=3051663 RepID=UPI00261A8BE6|nr:GNAT family N-acetyltransferase [Demequina sp. SYSU T00068]MDN4489443.1 GNAT family N-acetyltransferase [Demequina sp. SYSU T00068]